MPKKLRRTRISSSDDESPRCKKSDDTAKSLYNTSLSLSPVRSLPPPPFLLPPFAKMNRRTSFSSSSSTHCRPPSPPSFLWTYTQIHERNVKQDHPEVEAMNFSGGENDPVKTYMMCQADALAVVTSLNKKYEQEVKTNSILTKRINKKSSKIDSLESELDCMMSEQDIEKSVWKEKESEWKEKESEWKEKESEWKEKESEWLKEESQWKKKEFEWQKKESEWIKKVGKCKSKEADWKEEAESGWKTNADVEWKQKVESEIQKKLQFEWKMMDADRKKLSKLEADEKRKNSQIEDLKTLVSIQGIQLRGYKRLIRSVVPCLKQLKSQIYAESQACELCTTMMEIVGKIDDATLAHADNTLYDVDTPQVDANAPQTNVPAFKIPSKKMKKTSIWPRSSTSAVPGIVPSSSTPEKQPAILELNLVQPGTSLHLLSEMYSSPKTLNCPDLPYSMESKEHVLTSPGKRKFNETDESKTPKKTCCDVSETSSGD